MAKINKHIEIVRSSQTRLSSMSQRSCSALLQVLHQRFMKVGVTTIDKAADLERLVAIRPALVFLGMKFAPDTAGHKVWLAEYLDAHGIAYTGSSQKAHELELNKHLAKQRVLEAGLGSSPFYLASQNQPLNEASLALRFPLFVKPANRGGGLGIDNDSVVNDFEQLQSKVQSIADCLQSDSLVEEYLPGREFSVALLASARSGQLSVMPVELVVEPDARGVRLISGQTKSANTERVAAVADDIIRLKVETLAVKAFEALDGRDYGRIDIRLDATGQPHFLEANLLPSLISGYGSFPKACVINTGLNYEDMIMQIAELGLSRSAQPSHLVATRLPVGFAAMPFLQPAFK